MSAKQCDDRIVEGRIWVDLDGLPPDVDVLDALEVELNGLRDELIKRVKELL